ncbi:MAG: hypothetical protein M1838_002984 [Thelocarpon superellum]|nr:MAG: hypothetical protein M1838_002984 [Thelocarpon superellum]
MVAPCSPHRSAGGTLHLPSPSAIHHHDATAAIRSLRRSLSRSPSRGPAFHLVTSPSSSASSKSPLSPSPRPTYYAAAPSAPSPLAIPFPPSAKIHRTSGKKAGSMRVSLRSRTSPASPARRPLMQSRDHGNAAGSSPGPTKARADGLFTRSASPVEKSPAERGSRRASMIVEDHLRAPNHALARMEKSGHLVTTGAASMSMSSPLKRSDGVMNLDQASLGSPVAKRRSLHAPAAAEVDFNLFDPASLAAAAEGSAEMTDADASHDAAVAAGDATGLPPSSPLFASMPKRSSSLRKSTLQQRHDKPTFARARLNPDLALEFANLGAGATRGKPHRMSLENFLPPMARESPFASPGMLPNASMHLLSHQPGDSQHVEAPQAPPHPLSHAMTQSSSSSSVVDDSPTHAPLRNRDHSRPPPPFSRSLPAGAARPSYGGNAPHDPSSQGSSSEASYVTPHNYRLVKPLPAAFMSTGLISKRNRHPEDAQLASKAPMPDTPCKRPTSIFQPAPAPLPTSAFGQGREVRHEFGTPSTPFNPHASRPVPGTFGKGVSIFGSRFGGGSLVRRGSFVSIDGDEAAPSPTSKGDSQSSEYDLPPTPTKHSLGLAPAPLSVTSAAVVRPADGRDAMHLMAGVSAPGLIGAAQGSPDRSLEGSERASPQTPQEMVLPPDPSGLSISGHGDGGFVKPTHHCSSSASTYPPATPTAARDSFPPHKHRPLVGPLHSFAAAEVDPSLISRFDKVELVGTGEFSQVYRVARVTSTSSPVSHQPQSSATSMGAPSSTVSRGVFAVKKSRHAYAGVKDRQRKIHEVEVLRALQNSDHVVQFMDSWEERNHLYIQTEFCEEGSLDMFLAQVGRRARLDDFRIWKVMLELAQGLKHIHDTGFIHLDLKPANVLITFEGVLKIGDFGMANAWPAPPGIDGEGDREYIGPEILMGKFDKPADVFALGLIMLEIAGNVELPDNGPSWQKLRTGDMSDVPSLTSNSSSTVSRDSSGNPVSPDHSAETFYASDSGDEHFGSPSLLRRARREARKEEEEAGFVGMPRRGELLDPPSFMTDAQNEQALDRVVRWMISPNPADRPVVDQILQTVGVTWAYRRRRSGATIYEGNWGPADDVLGAADVPGATETALAPAETMPGLDTEMVDG